MAEHFCCSQRRPSPPSELHVAKLLMNKAGDNQFAGKSCKLGKVVQDLAVFWILAHFGIDLLAIGRFDGHGFEGRMLLRSGRSKTEKSGCGGWLLPSFGFAFRTLCAELADFCWGLRRTSRELGGGSFIF